MTFRLKTNLTAGIVSILCGTVLALMIPSQIGLDFGVTYGVTSRTIPYAIAALWIICGVALLVQSLVLKKESTKEIKLTQEAKAIGYMAVLAAYICGFQKNFLIATSLLGVITLAFMKVTKLWYYVICLAVTVFLWAMFTQVLHVALP